MTKKQLTIIAQAIILSSQLGTGNVHAMMARVVRRTTPMAQKIMSDKKLLATTLRTFPAQRQPTPATQQRNFFSLKNKINFSGAISNENYWSEFFKNWPGFKTDAEIFEEAFKDVDSENGIDLAKNKRGALLTKFLGAEKVDDAAVAQFKKFITTSRRCDILYTNYDYREKDAILFDMDGERASGPSRTKNAKIFPTMHANLQKMSLDPEIFAQLCKFDQGLKLVSRFINNAQDADAYMQFLNEQNFNHMVTHNKADFFEHGKSHFISALIQHTTKAIEFLPYITEENFKKLLGSEAGFTLLDALTKKDPARAIPYIEPFQQLFNEWVQSLWTYKDGRQYNPVLSISTFMIGAFGYHNPQKDFQERIWPSMYPDGRTAYRQKIRETYRTHEWANNSRAGQQSAAEEISPEEQARRDAVHAAWKFQEFIPTAARLTALIAQVDKSALEFCGYPKSLEESSKRRKTILKLIHPDLHPMLHKHQRDLMEEFAKKVNNAFDIAEKPYKPEQK